MGDDAQPKPRNLTRYFIALLGVFIILCELVEYFLGTQALDKMDKDDDTDGYYVSLYHGLETPLINFINNKETIENKKIKNSDLEAAIQKAINEHDEKLENVTVSLLEKQSTCNEAIYGLQNIDGDAEKKLKDAIEDIASDITKKVTGKIEEFIDLSEEENEIENLELKIKKTLKCSSDYSLMGNKDWLLAKLLTFLFGALLVLGLLVFVDMKDTYAYVNGFLGFCLFGLSLFEFFLKIWDTEKLSAKCRKQYTKDYIRFFMYIYPAIKMAIFGMIFVYCLVGPDKIKDAYMQLKEKSKKVKQKGRDFLRFKSKSERLADLADDNNIDEFELEQALRRKRRE